jgi:hypothetical protein
VRVRVGLRAGSALGLLGALACGDARVQAPARSDAAAPRSARAPEGASGEQTLRGEPPAGTPAPEAVAKRSGPAVKALRGALLRGGPAHEGQLLATDQVLALAAGAVLTLDFSKNARVVVHGPAELMVAPHGEQALLLRRGAAQVDLPPAAPTPESGFLAVTPGLHLALVRGGRLAVRVFDDGFSEVSVVSGGVATVAGDAAAVMLSAGQGLRAGIAGPAERAQLGALTLDGALERLQRMPERGGHDAQLRAALDGELGPLVEQVAADEARQAQLVALHRKRIGTPDALAAQSEVAAHAGQLARTRARLRALVWRRGALRLESAPAADDALGQRAESLLPR